MKTKITLKVLEQRISKKLSKGNFSLHKASVRGNTIESLGPYYIVNDNTNSIVSQGIYPDRLVEIGKEMAALAAWERVEF